MAATEVISIPSSSPLRVFARSPTPVQISSSPGLPSLSSILAQKEQCSEKQFRTSAVQREGFQKTTILLSPIVTSLRGLREAAGAMTPLKSNQIRANKTIERLQLSSGNKPATEVAVPAGRPSKKRKLDKASIMAGVDGVNLALTKATKTMEQRRKSSAQNTPGDAQTKIRKGQVTKAGLTKKGAKRADDAVEDTVASNVDETLDRSIEIRDLSLDKATRRRGSWTPVKDTPNIRVDDDQTDTRVCRASFTDLCGSFGYNEPSIAEPIMLPSRDNGTASLLKGGRNVVESRVKPVSKAKELSKPKEKKVRSKSPPKKPITITERATSNYFGEDKEHPAPILQYLTSDMDQAPKVSIHDELSKARKLPKSLKAKSKRKSQTSVNKVKPPPLLPPEPAQQAFQNQDLLFGTASQLAGDESPTFIRDAQQALKVSDAPETPADSFQDSGHAENRTTAPNRSSRSTSLLKASRGLWSVAARDQDGSFLEPEVLNLIDTPEAQRLLACPPSPPYEPPTTTVSQDQFHTEIRQTNLNLDSTMLVTTAKDSIQMHSVPPLLKKGSAQNRGTSQRAQKLAPQEADTPNAAAAAVYNTPPKPNHEAFTTAELTAKISSNGFKPIKSRNRMIALLDQCWEDRQTLLRQHARVQLSTAPVNQDEAEMTGHVQAVPNQASLGSSQEGAKVSQASTLQAAAVVTKPPNKRRGRPHKQSADATQQMAQSAQKRPLPKSGLTSNANKPASVHSSPKPGSKARFHRLSPKKAPAISNNPAEIEEISDSEVDLSPPPPRRSRSSNSQPPKPLPLYLPIKQAAPSIANLDDAPLPTSSLPEISSSIHSAILAEKRPVITDPSQKLVLTFHEKMLMYQPIVIEDMTRWLNNTGFKLVDEDREVGPFEVRQWLESRGICCLWGDDQHGWKNRRKGKR